MKAADIWKTLGTMPTTDKLEIRRAYARALKLTNPEDDPEGFKSLREAYEQALKWAKYKQAADSPESAVSLSDQPVALPHTMLTQSTPAFKISVFGLDSGGDEPAALRQALMKLEQLLTSDAKNDSMLVALSAILGSPALELIDLRSEAESRLAQMIICHSPSSDCLLEPAISRFRWDKMQRVIKANWQVEQVLKRRDDYSLLVELQKPSHYFYKPYIALTGPAQPITFKRRLERPAPMEVSDLLKMIRTQHQTLENDLNPKTVALWNAFFSKPRLSATTLWSLILSPACLIFMAIIEFNLPNVWRILDLILIMPLAWATVTVLYHYVYAVPHYNWLQFKTYTTPSWLKYGWAPALIALLFSATQPLLSLSYVVAAASFLIGLWAIVTGEPDTRESNLLWQFRALLRELYLFIWWLFIVWDLSLPYKIEMSAALVAALSISAYGTVPLFRLWIQLSSGWQLVCQITLIALSIAAGALLIMASAAPEWSLIAVAAVASVTVFHKVPMTERAGSNSGRLLYYVLLGGTYFARTISEHIPMLLVGGIALMLWAVIVTLTEMWPSKDAD